MQLDEISALVDHGRFPEAVRELESLRDDVGTGDMTRLGNILYLLGLALVGTGSVEEALKAAEDCLILSKETNDPLKEVDALIIKSSALQTDQRMGRSTEHIATAERVLQSIGMQQSWWDRVLVKGVVTAKAGIDATTAGGSENTITISLSEYSQRDTMVSLLHGQAFLRRGELETAYELWQQSLRLAKEAEHTPSVLKLLAALAECHWDTGDRDKCMEYMEKYLEVAEQGGDKLIIAKGLEKYGRWLMQSGEIMDATEKLTRGLDIAEILDATPVKCAILDVMGWLHYGKGEIDTALELWQRYASMVEGNDVATTARDLLHFGMIEQARGNYDFALRHYGKCVELLNKTDHFDLLHQVFARLIPLTIEEGNLDDARHFIAEVDELRLKFPLKKAWDQAARLYDALVQRSSDRAAQKFGAGFKLEEIVAEDVTDHQITTIAMINLCDLLLLELKIFGNKKVLEGVKMLVARLVEFAKKQGSVTLSIEASMLQADIALLELDATTALSILSEAQAAAEEKELGKWARMVSTKFDAALEQVQQWENLSLEDASFEERWAMAEIDQALERMRLLKAEDAPSLPQEDPVMLLLLHESGLSLFSKPFRDSLLDDQLIGGMITAIVGFSKEAFSTSGSLERIRHQDYTLLIKPSEPLLFCYVFRGQSYTAIEKLDTFMRKISMSDEVWHKLSASVSEMDDELESYLE